MKYCAYYRVSRKTQAASGLGLEAQQESVRRFLRDGDAVVVPHAQGATVDREA